MIVLQHSTSSN